MAPWEEVVGTIHAIDHEGGAVVATIGAMKVILPPEMAEMLEPLLGQRIATIRVDDTGRPYRVRTFRRSE
ncbi:hypothetical protein P0O24_11960 [Methanotrichaceae archaeon M04Ac]|uniref:Uncharacterized protein n=1 Tax=Candidatus Methanocrinis alkalitolerans TaxID=3033395 RepID=A0ABT5XHV4_9EURY|nr:hypothetical protein [Candidatus Methanocrinis alkalitolerans]MDF0594294.1 hypothetical protein [Candidatus Methanocrinis alkalitolerans]